MLQSNLFYFILISVIFLTVIKYSINIFINRKKTNFFINKYFYEDRLYSLKEVSSVFRVGEEHFIKLIKTLENYNYFPFFKKLGVTMAKDYYSQYELKALIKILVKKNKLKI